MCIRDRGSAVVCMSESFIKMLQLPVVFCVQNLAWRPCAKCHYLVSSSALVCYYRDLYLKLFLLFIHSLMMYICIPILWWLFTGFMPSRRVGKHTSLIGLLKFSVARKLVPGITLTRDAILLILFLGGAPGRFARLLALVARSWLSVSIARV